VLLVLHSRSSAARFTHCACASIPVMTTVYASLTVCVSLLSLRPSFFLSVYLSCSYFSVFLVFLRPSFALPVCHCISLCLFLSLPCTHWSVHTQSCELVTFGRENSRVSSDWTDVWLSRALLVILRRLCRQVTGLSGYLSVGRKCVHIERL